MSDGRSTTEDAEDALNSACSPDPTLVSSSNDLPNRAEALVHPPASSIQPAAVFGSQTATDPQCQTRDVPKCKTQQTEGERLFTEAHNRREIRFKESESERESSAQTRELEFEAYTGRREDPFQRMENYLQESFRSHTKSRDDGENFRVAQSHLFQAWSQRLLKGDLDANYSNRNEVECKTRCKDQRDHAISLFNYMDAIVHQILWGQPLPQCPRPPVRAVSNPSGFRVASPKMSQQSHYFSRYPSSMLHDPPHIPFSRRPVRLDQESTFVSVTAYVIFNIEST